MGIFQIPQNPEVSVAFYVLGIYLLSGLFIAFAFSLLAYRIARFRREFARINKIRLNFTPQWRAGRSNHFIRRRRGLLTWFAAGMGMAVLASMCMPAPALANEFNLADRLLKNLETLNRMQSRGAAILIPDEFQEALDAHGEAMRHARAIVRLRAFQMENRGRRASAARAGRNDEVKVFDSLNRWALLEIIEHKSAGLAICETVDEVAHHFTVLSGIRWILRGLGYPAPDLSGPEIPKEVRERVQTYAAALKEIEGALRLLKAGGHPAAQKMNRLSARSKAREAALGVHRTGRPELYPVTASKR